MKKMMKILVSFAAVMFVAGLAWAQPMDGFSLMVSGVEHDNEIDVTSGPLSGVTFNYTSDGPGYGIDYQWALGTGSSFLLFIQTTDENVSDDLDAFDRAVHNYYGGQYRLWLGALYLGLQAGQYEVELTAASGGSSSKGSGPGYGYTIGLEGSGGWYISYQADTAEVAFEDADVAVMAQRVNLGLRFK